MKLINFSVTNFRSITKAHRISIANSTILIGKNNEGKSNILKALSIAMTALKTHAHPGRSVLYSKLGKRKNEKFYYWDRDFPITLQNRKGVKQSIFRLKFELNDSEILEFKDKTKSQLNGTLPLEIKIGADNQPVFKISKSGKGSQSLNSKSYKIAEFIASKIKFNYIPAIRTEKESLSVIEQMLSQELEILENNPDYLAAIEKIKQFQQPILDELAEKIKKPLIEFLPNISDVKIEISEKKRRINQRREFEVTIDDGTPTNIEYKGDGVKSLAALGILKNQYLENGVSIIAIEEPESHLHPSAIHQLNHIIKSLAETNQIIITTHNPLFVDRENIKTNILIDKTKAVSAKNVREIRNILGVKASDNLINANYALVVEGEEDVMSLKSILPNLSDKLQKALKNNLLVIEPIGGAGNLPYKLSLLDNALCVFHVLLDNDDAGRKSFEKAKKDNLVSIKNVTMLNCMGMSNSEFEDCIDLAVYKDIILTDFGVDLESTKFRGNRKWSERIKTTFMNQGKPWNDDIEKQVKAKVSQCVSQNPANCLHSHKSNSINALVTALEKIIKE